MCWAVPVLRLSRARTKSSIQDNNRPGRPEILKQVSLSQDEEQWLDESFRKYKEQLKIKLNNSEEFKEFKKNRVININYFWPYLIIIPLLIGCLSISLFANFLLPQDWYDTATAIADKVSYILATAFFVQLTNDIRRS